MGHVAIGEGWIVQDPDGWQFVSRRGHPQQVYGEPFPSHDWIVSTVQDLYYYRQQRRYRQADATRQWLLDYGIEVECGRDRIRAKW